MLRLTVARSAALACASAREAATLLRIRPQASISYDTSNGSWMSVSVLPFEIAFAGAVLLESFVRVAFGDTLSVGK